MNVALLNPPAPGGGLFTREGRCTQRSSMWAAQWPPVSLTYLAAVLRDGGFTPMVLDCSAASIDEPTLLRELTRLQPALCIVAVSTPSFAGDMRVLAAIKRALPQTRIAIFGAHATTLAAEILANEPSVDFVVRHEPELTALALAQALCDSGSPAEVTGLAFRDDDRVQINDVRPYIDDLDSLPFPAWDAVRLDDYRLPFSLHRFLCLVPQRGCPYRCTFCTASAYYGKRLRKRSVVSLIDEIKRNRREFGVDDVFMWAETFTLDREFILELTGAMQRETPGIRWTCNSRTDTVDEELLREMKTAGCWMLSFGIESADAKVLAEVKKDLRATDVAAPLRQARALGIKTVGHFIFGLPGETSQSMNETLRLALSLELDIAQFYAAAPFVGSELFAQAKQANWLADTEFDGMNQRAASLRLPGLPPAQVDAMVRRAFWRFYLRPLQIKRLLDLAGFGIVRQLFHEMRRYWKRIGGRV